jgi:hypothetical protein
MLGLGTVLTVAFYTAVTFGRYTDFGYGPRFELPVVVALAVGSGALVARMLHGTSARQSARGALALAGPAVLMLAALTVGVVRLVPIMYPFAHDILWKRSALYRAIRAAHLHHAVVTVASGDVYGGPLLDTQNDPNDPDGEVIIVGETVPGDVDCARRWYKDRKFYRAVGQADVVLNPH